VLTDPDEATVVVGVGVEDGAAAVAVMVGVVGANVEVTVIPGVNVRVAEGTAVSVRVDVAEGLRVGEKGIRVEVAVREGVEEASPTAVGAAPSETLSTGGDLPDVSVGLEAI
jgi:hypothetical protein